MKILNDPALVNQRLAGAARNQRPVLCPNAETADEMEGVLQGAEDVRAERGLEQLTIGLGITATYPDHPQLGLLSPVPVKDGASLLAAARLWMARLRALEQYPGWERIEVIPFLDHGWAPHEADCALMNDAWFQEEMGIIMFDASAYDIETNTELTAHYVKNAGERVVVEACPDKVYERREAEEKGLTEKDLLSDPEGVERFVEATGVRLIVPNLGTEHRTASAESVRYQRDLAREIAARVGGIMALHGTSSLGSSLGRVGEDGVCKINYYTAMARAASTRVREAWSGAGELLGIAEACGGFVHRTRRAAAREALAGTLRLCL